MFKREGMAFLVALVALSLAAACSETDVIGGGDDDGRGSAETKGDDDDDAEMDVGDNAGDDADDDDEENDVEDVDSDHDGAVHGDDDGGDGTGDAIGDDDAIPEDADDDDDNDTESPDATDDDDAGNGDVEDIDAGDDDGGEDNSGDDDAGDDDTEIPDPKFKPNQRGPYSVGHRELSIQKSVLKSVPLGVWYPAQATGSKTKYMGLFGWGLVEGNSYEDAPVDPSGAPYPLVMFSHGNKGINYQSFSIYEYLVSHGFIVAAPDHEGNTLMDNPSDQQMAEIAKNRPADIMQAMQTLISNGFLNQVMDVNNKGVMGHSFGGYTALVLAGGFVNRDAAKARCDAGIEADVFCPYVGYWPPGSIMRRPNEADGAFKASLALAPGGYAAFGDEGLKTVDMPVFLAGGTLDEYTKNDLEPIYNALTVEKYLLVIEKAGHMSFTDICNIPGVQFIPTLGEMCDPATHIEIKRCMEITNTFVAAFFSLHLKGDRGMIPYLTPEFAATYPEATLRK